MKAERLWLALVFVCAVALYILGCVGLFREIGASYRADKAICEANRMFSQDECI